MGLILRKDVLILKRYKTRYEDRDPWPGDKVIGSIWPLKRGIARFRSASLFGRLWSSVFRLSTTAASTSLAGSCFSSDSARRPFHHGIRRRGGTISATTLPLAIGRSKQTYELTSSIVPRGTSFHHWWSSSFLL